MSFRKERKFKLSTSDFELIKNRLLLNGMQTIYAKRTINSLYYDNELYDMFNDSEEGLLPRKKVRIRWYHDVSNSFKETKISSVEGRYKTKSVANLRSWSELPQNFYEPSYGIIHPSLLVSYTREYFSFENMRITFDSNIEYMNYRQSQNIRHKDGERVMEVKVDIHVPDDYIENILPYTNARFSKYSRGLLFTNSEW